MGGFVDGAFNEALAGCRDTISLVLLGDGGVRVVDGGCGSRRSAKPAPNFAHAAERLPRKPAG
ncbi:hypothetical protein, partial [Asanoa iriomotensis]|uniref:hypothetical protein n=1 Tax=Asanoa iriomotensis TaxID=234613 RepID=UPI001942B2D7